MHDPRSEPGSTLPNRGSALSEADCDVVVRAGRRTVLWGVTSAVVGLLAASGAVSAFLYQGQWVELGLKPAELTILVVSLVPIALTHLSTATLYARAGSRLRAVPRAAGNPVDEVVNALHRLGTAFSIEFTIGVLALCVGSYVGFAVERDGLDRRSDVEPRREAEY